MQTNTKQTLRERWHQLMLRDKAKRTKGLDQRTTWLYLPLAFVLPAFTASGGWISGKRVSNDHGHPSYHVTRKASSG